VEFAAAAPELWGFHYDPNSLETPEAAAAAEAKAAKEAAQAASKSAQKPTQTAAKTKTPA
jgi:hypothetical protein